MTLLAILIAKSLQINVHTAQICRSACKYVTKNPDLPGKNMQAPQSATTHRILTGSMLNFAPKDS